jgi:hypothetical protein
MLETHETTNIFYFSNQFLALCPLLPTLKGLKINLSLVGISNDMTMRVLQGCVISSRDPENKLIIGSQNPSIIKVKGRWWGWE